MNLRQTLAINTTLGLPGECWTWTGKRHPAGYGYLFFEGRTRMVHILAWESWMGAVPDGKELDHRCRNKACFFPGHLDPVSHQVNCERGFHLSGADHWNGAKTECPNGHQFTPENTYLHRGRRGCRICRKEQGRAWVLRKRQGAER